MVCAEIDGDQADEAIRILEESNSVDFDERQEQWRGDGWAGWTGGTMNNQGVASSSPQMAAGYNQQQPQQQQAFQAGGQMGGQAPGQMGAQMGGQESGRTVEEQRIPVVEEELRVGKREVNRGGARVRSYVREVPVHEQVSLREEHVDVERRPVSGERLSPADASGLLQERTIEMTETAEEAVVAKEARVAEEVVVRKTADQHVEQIDDSVRRTEVDVQEGVTGADRSAFGFQGDRQGETGRMSDTERAEFERTNNPAYRP
jgi:uncharacterized protein (TIGR02271 family)